MNVFHTRESLFDVLSNAKEKGQSIGFVPTMGALHEGHLALVKRALSESEVVVVSIFVNPTQFNNTSDLEKYPRMLEKDVALLETIGKVLIFAPDYSEVYPENDDFKPIDLEGMDIILEGKFRPGHFQGVVHVVRNLFRIVNPNKAFFGLKDFQQLAIIKLMVRKLNMQVEIVECSTLRAESGLALSSRNLRLNTEQQKDALVIFKTLEYIREIKRTSSPQRTKEQAIEFFRKGNLELEYLEIVDSKTLKLLTDTWTSDATCCLAAFCSDVRLIDNMQYK